MNRRLLMLPLLFGLSGLAAQEPPKAPDPAERLLQLLRELRAADPTIWTAHLAALEAQAKARDAEAATLRQQQKELEQRAAAADTEAKALRAEVARLQELQKLVASLLATNPAPADATKPAPTDAPKPAPEAPKMQPNAPAPAPEAGKTAPPKVEPKVEPKKGAAAPPAPMTPEGKDHGEFVTWARVSTIFADHCTSCHDPTEQKGGLDLTTFAAARNGGGSGQSIVAGAPDQSRLYRMVTQQERPFMPRNADPLGKEQQALLRTWIEQGACDDAASAKAFLVEQANAAKAAAVAVEAANADANAVPMPEAIPPLALRTPMRPGPVASFARSPRAPLLAMPGMQQVLLYNADLQRIAVLPCAFARIGPVAFAEDGSLVLAAGGEPGQRGVAVLFDVRTGTVLATCGNERDVPLAAAVHRGAGLVALGGSSKHVRVYRFDDGEQVLAGKHDDFVLSLSFAPDGRWIAAGDRAGTVQVWETKGGRVFQTLQGHQGAVHALAFDRSGASLVTAGADGTVRLWNVAEAKERWRQNAHPSQQALAVAFGPGDAIASCGSDGLIQVFSASGSPVAKSAAIGEWLYALAFGADDGVVFAGDWQGRVHRFDVKQKQLTATVPLAQAQ